MTLDRLTSIFCLINATYAGAFLIATLADQSEFIVSYLAAQAAAGWFVAGTRNWHRDAA